jgi:hypothetical protein
MNPNGLPRSLVSEVQLFRIRVATAESKLKLLREEARQARRRRKEAKRIAQQARKRFKRSKSDLAELRQALAKAETRLFRAGERALARKIAKPRPLMKRRAHASTKSKAITRRPRPFNTQILQANSQSYE